MTPPKPKRAGLPKPIWVVLDPRNGSILSHHRTRMRARQEERTWLFAVVQKYVPAPRAAGRRKR